MTGSKKLTEPFAWMKPRRLSFYFQYVSQPERKKRRRKKTRPEISTKRVKQRSQRQRWLSDGDGDERWVNGDEIGSLVARRSPITAPVKEAESEVEGQVKRKRREKTE